MTTFEEWWKENPINYRNPPDLSDLAQAAWNASRDKLAKGGEAVATVQYSDGLKWATIIGQVRVGDKLYLHPAVPDARIAELEATVSQLKEIGYTWMGKAMDWSRKNAELQAKLDAAIPAGHVVVPVEPTEAMMKYVCNCDTSVSPVDTCKEAWARLLAAAQESNKELK